MTNSFSVSSCFDPICILCMELTCSGKEEMDGEETVELP